MNITTFTQNQPYTKVLAQQEQTVADVLAGAPPTLFIGQHPPTITLGSSANGADILTPEGFEVVKTGRGGQVTLHHAGQIVAYPIVDLRQHKQDIRWYVRTLQNIIIKTLADFNIEGKITDDIGVWVTVNGPEGQMDKKIAAIGIRIRKWVTFHGLALNVENNLADYKRIIPCGLSNKAVTNFAELGINAPVADVQARLIAHISAAFFTAN